MSIRPGRISERRIGAPVRSALAGRTESETSQDDDDDGILECENPTDGAKRNLRTSFGLQPDPILDVGSGYAARGGSYSPLLPGQHPASAQLHSETGSSWTQQTPRTDRRLTRSYRWRKTTGSIWKIRASGAKTQAKTLSSYARTSTHFTQKIDRLNLLSSWH